MVLNIDLRPAFAQIDRVTQPGTSIYVVNERGDYLTHPDGGRAFGFAFGTPFRIQDDLPGLGNAIVTGERQPALLDDRSGKRQLSSMFPSQPLPELGVFRRGLRRLVGDLSDKRRVLTGLNIVEK